MATVFLWPGEASPNDVRLRDPSQNIGGLATTEEGDLVAAVGTLPTVGTADITEADDSSASTGTLPLVGTSTATEADDTLTTVATVKLVASLTLIEETDGLFMTGVFHDPGVGIASIIEAGDVVLASGWHRLRHTSRSTRNALRRKAALIAQRRTG